MTAPDLTRLMRWARLSPYDVQRSYDVRPVGDGVSTPIAQYSKDLLFANAEAGYLATSDDPLYLVCPGDSVTFTLPTNGLTISVPSPGPSSFPGRDYHAAAASWLSYPPHLGLPEGSYASAVSRNGICLIRRDAPSSPWHPIMGPAQHQAPQRTTASDLANPPWADMRIDDIPTAASEQAAISAQVPPDPNPWRVCADADSPHI